MSSVSLFRYAKNHSAASLMTILPCPRGSEYVAPIFPCNVPVM